MLVTEHKALELAILLNADSTTREKLIVLIHSAFSSQQVLDSECLISEIKMKTIFEPQTFKDEINHYGLCLRLELCRP